MMRKVIVAGAVLALIGCPSDDSGGGDEGEGNTAQAGTGGGAGMSGGSTERNCIDIPRSELADFSDATVNFIDCTTRSLRNYRFCPSALPVVNGTADTPQIILRYTGLESQASVFVRPTLNKGQRYDVRMSGRDGPVASETDKTNVGSAVGTCAHQNLLTY